MATSINKAVREALKGAAPDLSGVVRSMQMSQHLAEYIKGFQALREQMVNSLTEMAKRQKEFAKYQQGLRLDFSNMREGMRLFKAHLPEQLKILADNGWFVSGNHTPLAAIYPLAQMFRSGHADEANRQVGEYTKNHLAEIEDMLVGDFPNRAGIIKKAFNALRSGDYELSIPAMLAQADGIGREIIAANVPKFSLTSKQPKFQNVIRDFIAKFADGSLYTGDIFELILVDIPLTVSEGHPLLKPGVLNRNAILHGAETAYATELNALRAVSWIDYVSYFGCVASLKKLPSSKK